MITKKPEFNMDKKDKTVKKFANDEEERVAKLVGGKRSPNSGATRFLKGDIYSGDYLLDVKSAMKASRIIVTEQMLRKIERESAQVGKKPVIVLTFSKSKILNNKEWVVMPL